MVASIPSPDLDVEAFSGICGTISIVAWLVVFSPQILENFRRGSSDGLSLHFLVVWLLGDIFNVVGAILQGVLPTMIILAIYFTVADIVLLAQCFFYRGFTWKEKVLPSTPKPMEIGEPNERTTLLDGAAADERRSRNNNETHSQFPSALPIVSEEPATPLTYTRLQMHLRNIVAVLLVCTTGMVSWYLIHHSTSSSRPAPVWEVPEYDIWGQIFGWLGAVFYFASRFPQLILNWRRKSVEGLSILFFLFACLGNFMYVFSIIAFDPTSAVPNRCQSCNAGKIYGRHILVNLPWLVDGLGTLLLDIAIFAQFFLYGEVKSIGGEV
ncbi:PQ loop repeat protein [Dothidotthia symphoricarpi CBS 119687]|uniref:PQ loop repeat protein n=1 Tax=Dothidotthia symphoricarpi CBS 119687 TaxID=1392245 RepID=A0A6A6AMW2_9PLEO|nr:PQ loop repeat protein [Dothidotthia symphoricarpi CBS 119687]KAF2132478.1 PQ loop repeat protein [Dothidotthia symphoricarpi CBS 119687]